MANREQWVEELEEEARETARMLVNASIYHETADDVPASMGGAWQGASDAVEDPLGFGPIDLSTVSLVDGSAHNRDTSLPQMRSLALCRRRVAAIGASRSHTPSATPSAKQSTTDALDNALDSAELQSPTHRSLRPSATTNEQQAQQQSYRPNPADIAVLEALPTSEYFKPHKYLQKFHSHRSAAELQRGLEALKSAQAEKSGQLQEAVKEHFKRFVDLRDTMAQVHTQLHANESSSRNDAPASAQLQQSIDSCISQLDTTFGSLFAWQGQVSDRRDASNILDGFKWLFHLPKRIKEHVHKGDIESVCREYSHACDIVQSDDVNIVKRVLAVARREIDALFDALRAALKDSKLRFEDAYRIVERLRELDSLRSRHDAISSGDASSQYQEQMQQQHQNVRTQRMKRRASISTKATPELRVDPLWSLLSALQRCVEAEVERVEQSVKDSIAKIDGAKHARKRSMERWQSAGAELSTRQKIDFDKLLASDPEEQNQCSSNAADSEAKDCSESSYTSADSSAAHAHLQLVSDSCACLQNLLPRLWKFVLSEQLHENGMDNEPDETPPASPFAGRKGETSFATTSKPQVDDVAKAVSNSLSFACERMKRAMVKLQHSKRSEESFREALDQVRMCHRNLMQQGPPRDSTMELQRLYAWGLEILTGRFTEKLCSETEALGASDIVHANELATTTSDIAEKASVEIRNAALECGSTSVEEALMSMQLRFYNSFKQVANGIERASHSVAAADVGSSTSQLLPPVLMQAEELWTGGSAKTMCLKLLSNCTNIRCNLLHRLSEEFASITGSSHYVLDLERRSQAEQALLSVEQHLMSLYLRHKEEDFEPIASLMMDAEDLRDVENHTPRGLRDVAMSCITAMIVTHKEIELAGLSDASLLTRCMETFVNLLHKRAGRHGEGRTLALNEKGYSQLSLELDVLAKVFGLPSDEGCGARLRAILSEEISCIDSAQAAGKASKELRAGHSQHEANAWEKVVESTRRQLASGTDRNKLHHIRLHSPSQGKR